MKKESVDDDLSKELFGAFKSDQTAEEMIKDIRSSRHTNRQMKICNGLFT